MKRKLKKILIIIAAILVLIIIVQIINASKYKMAVNVVEGKNVMGLNPLADKLDFGDLSRNNGMIRSVALKNGGRLPTFITVLKFGEIADLVKTDKNYFILKPGEEVKLSFEIHIPPSAQTKKYDGWTMIFRAPKVF